MSLSNIMKKTFLCSAVLVLTLIFVFPAHAASVHEFLCEEGARLYKQGLYDYALDEFKKALIIFPGYKPAQDYIQKIRAIKQKTGKSEAAKARVADVPSIPLSEKKEIVDRELIMIEQLILGKETHSLNPVLKQPADPSHLIQTEVLGSQMLSQEVAVTGEGGIDPPVTMEEEPPEISEEMVILDESLSKGTAPVQVELGKGVIISGKSIQRFLVIQPDILKVVQQGADELLVVGRQIGYTYMHVWDENGRWTLEFLIVPARVEGPTLEDQMRQAEELAENFKVLYSMDWSLFEKGRSFRDLGRTDYFYNHNLSLWGQTPYGDLDSTISVNQFQYQATKLSHYTLGLTNGQLGPFQGFSLRGFDFFDIPPYFSNLSFPGIALRGVMFSSPAFNNHLKYTVFHGKENPTSYGNLSFNLNTKKDAFLEGINLDYSPIAGSNYRFNFVRGWGQDREENLHNYGYDLMGSWDLGAWKIRQEVAFDSNTFANTLDTHYIRPNLDFDAQIRNINKKFLSITGSSWSQGELGGLFHLNYRFNEKLSFESSLDVFRDRLFPAQADSIVPNEDFTSRFLYQFDPKTSLKLNYTLQNRLGSLSRYRYQNADIGLAKSFKFIREINTSLTYFHQENTNFSSHMSDYINDRIYAGLRFDLIRNLFYYANAEVNWLRERFSKNRTFPNAYETGLDWSGQIGQSPFHNATRITYRNEQDTASPLSFLSGEDYIEGYSELSFRPAEGSEIYASARVRNVWADNQNVTKRLEGSFNSGVRYLWNTGLSWQSEGDIDGYVFKDYNADGLRENNEPPISGVKIWLGKNRSEETDIFGYFRFKKVSGRLVPVTIDTATIPAGFVLTVPATQSTYIKNFQTSRLEFGLVARSEISGFVFEDVDGDGRYSSGDVGVRGVSLTLENGLRGSTDDRGRYSFPHVSSGEHILNLDLSTVPVYYLPEISITKKITLFEGVVFVHNIPLKRTKD